MPAYWTTRKPPAGTQLNREHPLSQGMVVCLPLWEGSGWRVADLGKSRLATNCVQSGTPSLDNVKWLPGKGGPSLQLASRASAGAGPYLKLNGINRLLNKAPGWTFCVRFYVTVFPTAGNVGKVINWWIGPGIDGCQAGVNDVNAKTPYMQVVSQSGNDTQHLITSTRTINLTTWYDMAFLCDISGQRANFGIAGALESWQTGIAFFTGVYTPGATQANKDALGASQNSGSGFSLPGQIEYAYLYRRVLTPWEVAAIAEQPYQMFAAPSRTRSLF